MSDYIFKLPDLGEGTVEAEISEWMVKVGDVVQEEDTICAMLTDKAAVELTSPVNGKVTSLAGEVGDMVAVGSSLITFATAEVVSESTTHVQDGVKSKSRSSNVKADEPANKVTQSSTVPVSQPAGAGVKTSPSIRQRAREAGIDLNQVRGTGPGGRIQQGDFDAYLARPAASAQKQEPSKKREHAAGSTEIKVIGVRRKIAQRMEQANREVPHFTYVEEVDVTALESLRQQLNKKVENADETLTLLPFIGLALTRVLPQFPQCNAHYDANRNVLIQHHAVHLGIATQTDDGLKVPVVYHAETFSLDQMAQEIRRVSKSARSNTLSREELSGSTITLTSLGRLGGIVSTPLINLPEVAIIGVNKAVPRPVVFNGQMAVRTIMNLSSSFDHRFVDGYDAASLIQALKLMLEQPATIFISN